MKKLKLKLNGVEEVLSKDQLKKINGGYSQCGGFCVNGGDCYPSHWGPQHDCRQCSNTWYEHGVCYQ